MHRGIAAVLCMLSLSAASCGKSAADVLLEPPPPDAGGPVDSAYLATRAQGYGFVGLAVSSDNQILSLRTIVTVPAEPTDGRGTLFLAPGLQPGGQNFEPIENGVLEPVLTWGPTCAPGSPNDPYAAWWIAGQYVNTYGSYTGYTGCLSGPGMTVQVGDTLSLDMSLNGTVWRQTVENLRDGTEVSFDLDMLGQSQNHAHFWLDPASINPVEDGVFESTTLTFANPEPEACQPVVRGTNDFFSNPHASADGTQCVIDRIVLRDQGVPASTQN